MNHGRPGRPNVPLKAVLSVRRIARLGGPQRRLVRSATRLPRWRVPLLRATADRELWWRGDGRPALAVLERDPEHAHPPTPWRLTLLAAEVPDDLDAVLEALAAEADRDDRVLLVDLGDRPSLVEPAHRGRLTAYGFVRVSARGLTRVPR